MNGLHRRREKVCEKWAVWINEWPEPWKTRRQVVVKLVVGVSGDERPPIGRRNHRMGKFKVKVLLSESHFTSNG